MSQPILITAAKEDAEGILDNLSGENIYHTPLEVYVPRYEDTNIASSLGKLNEIDNIVYSCKRNARFFLEQVKRFEKMEEVRDCLNLTFSPKAFEFLEEHDIPAVHPQNGEKPIDLMEMMLRLQRLGPTLYPAGSHQREDFPGFLEELDIPVKEVDVFDLEGPDDESLEAFRKDLSENSPGAVIFHSRRSVNRTRAAFPNLEYENMRVISADKGITNKLQENDISVDDEAEGSWESIAEIIKNGD